jgi:UDP-N-acetyl-D-mannosaminuronic acid dehydrogenase
VLDDCDVFFVAIDTPITASRRLDHMRLLQGLVPVARRLRPATMLVIESTIAPGTIDDVVVPALRERVPYALGRDYFLLHCPERLRPGRLLRNLRGLDRIVGGDSESSADVGIRLYRQIVRAKLQRAHYRTAEVIKTAENAARDVQIALANQIALVSEAAGVNFAEVRAAVNELWAQEPLVLEAGPGVGGHCLPKDPWLLVSQLHEDSARALVEGARRMNSFMPEHTARLARRSLEAAGVPIVGAVIVLLGVSYNADTDDVRNSPALDISRLLEDAGAEVRLHDPYVRHHAGDIWRALGGADVAILVDAHSPYLALNPTEVKSAMRRPIVVDTRRVLDAGRYRTAGFRYSALGVGERSE